MANLADEVLRVSIPAKQGFDRLQEELRDLRGRKVTQSEVLEELLKVYRHVAEES